MPEWIKHCSNFILVSEPCCLNAHLLAAQKGASPIEHHVDDCKKLERQYLVAVLHSVLLQRRAKEQSCQTGRYDSHLHCHSYHTYTIKDHRL